MMKKTLLATAIALVSVSANAATLYDQDGFTYEIDGDLQVQLRQKAGIDQELDLEFDDLEIKNSASYVLSDTMSAFAQLDFGFKDMANEDDGQTELEEAYVGLMLNDTAVSFGKQATAGDDFGIEKSIEGDLDGDRFGAVADSGDDVIRVESDLQGVTLIASYEMEAKGSDKADDSYLDLLIATDISGLALAAAYQQFDNAAGDNGIDTYGVSAAYGLGPVELAVDYSVSSADLDTDPANASQYNLAAGIAASSTTRVAVGITEVMFDDEVGVEDVTGYYANLAYQFPAASNVSVFAEVSNTDEDDSDLGYLAGMRVKF